jgi:hypothetical protein
MIIGVAGPYSAPTAEARKRNLDAMNIAAAGVYEKGHTPFIGLNMALPVLDKLDTRGDNYGAIMDISLVVIDKCDALLMLGESPGANRERDLVIAKGLPIYYSIEEIPTNK